MAARRRRSLNVSVATAVAMHWGRVAREASLGVEAGMGDLPPAEVQALLCEYMARGHARGFQKGVRQDASGHGGYAARRIRNKEREAYGTRERPPPAPELRLHRPVMI